MITITVAELKKFLDKSKNIKYNHILPIYGYVKLVCKKDKSVLMKSNGHSFVICEVEAISKKEHTLLIDEKTLSGMLAFTKGEEIKITYDDTKVKLDDGIRPVSCQFIADNYPVIQENTSTDKIALSKDVLDAMSAAKYHTQPSVDKTIRSWMSFVHLTKVGGKNYVCAFNGAVGYMKQFEESFPEISIDIDVIPIIAKYTQLEYSSTGNYDYFESIDAIYGFIKSETKCIDLTKAVENFVTAEKIFTIARQDLSDFCETVIAVNDSIIPPEVSVQTNKKSVFVKFTGMSGGQDAEQHIAAELSGLALPETFFLPKNIVTVLKSVDSEKITVSTIKNNFIITSEEDKSYMGSVMELAKI